MPEPLLTVEQAASRLHLQPSTIRRQLREGALRGVKRGHVWRVPESALYVSSGGATSALESADRLWLAGGHSIVSHFMVLKQSQHKGG